MKAIIEVTGRLGAGKTNIVIILGEELSPASILYIDASADQKLTHTLAPQLPPLTLGQLISRHTETAAHREAVDWVFHDLAITVGDEQELITVGNLPEHLDAAELPPLKYGLTRLIENYDYIILDGHHLVLHTLLPEEALQLLDIVTPEDFPHWQLSRDRDLIRTPALILNRYSNEPLPANLEMALNEHRIQLIGKLPRYQTFHEQSQLFASAFGNCLLRLNIPLSPNPQ
jgi:cellulose biosynthesis protein BcsQ